MHRRQKYSHGSYNSAKATHFASVAKSRFKSQFIVYSRFLACLQYSPKPEHLKMNYLRMTAVRTGLGGFTAFTSPATQGVRDILASTHRD